MRGQPWTVVAAVLAAALAGCVTDAPGDGFFDRDRSRIGPVEEFHVDESFVSNGDRGVDATWTWHVNATNFTTFRIEVSATGPEGGDVYNAGYRCLEVEGGGEDSGQRVDRRSGNCGDNDTGPGLSFQSAGTMFEYSREGDAPLGPWRLHLEVSPGAYEFRVVVDLAYGPDSRNP